MGPGRPGARAGGVLPAPHLDRQFSNLPGWPTTCPVVVGLAHFGAVLGPIFPQAPLVLPWSATVVPGPALVSQRGPRPCHGQPMSALALPWSASVTPGPALVSQHGARPCPGQPASTPTLPRTASMVLSPALVSQCHPQPCPGQPTWARVLPSSPSISPGTAVTWGSPLHIPAISKCVQKEMCLSQ